MGARGQDETPSSEKVGDSSLLSDVLVVISSCFVLKEGLH